MKIISLLSFFVSLNTFAIVGGVEPLASETPYVAHLQTASGQNCSAVLIGPDQVVTALHCLLPSFFNRSNTLPSTLEEAIQLANAAARELRIKFATESLFEIGLVDSVGISESSQTAMQEVLSGTRRSIFTTYDWVILNLKRPVTHAHLPVINEKDYNALVQIGGHIQIYGYGTPFDSRISDLLTQIQNWQQLTYIIGTRNLSEKDYQLETSLNAILSKITFGQNNLEGQTEYSSIINLNNLFQMYLQSNTRTRNRLLDEIATLVTEIQNLFPNVTRRVLRTATLKIDYTDMYRYQLSLSALDNTISGGCNGDSGGPVIIDVPHLGRRLVGITTSIDFCGSRTIVTPITQDLL